MKIKILKLDAAWRPLKWINPEDAILYHAQNKVIGQAGEYSITFHGGINQLSGEQSKISTLSIIAVHGSPYDMDRLKRAPGLNNEYLFKRDDMRCAYCNVQFKFKKELSCDHIIPRTQNGKHRWDNVITACKQCNHKKGGRTPEQANMKLHYQPYTPDFYELFLFDSDYVLPEQMEFLTAKIPNHSRIHSKIKKMVSA